MLLIMRATTPDAQGQPVDQIATIRVFWQPRGGVTTLDSSAVNATIRYIINPEGKK